MAAPDLSHVFGLHHGRVTSFDDHVGAGTVTASGSEPGPSTARRIADGSRTIAVDTAVSFRVAPGPTGLEAVDVSPA